MWLSSSSPPHVPHPFFCLPLPFLFPSLHALTHRLSFSVKAAAKKEAEKKKKADKKAKVEEEEAAAAGGKLSPFNSSSHLPLALVFPYARYSLSSFPFSITSLRYSSRNLLFPDFFFHLLLLTLVSSTAAAAAAASGPVDLSLLSAEEREKRAKAIRKKLKAVEEVKEKQLAGQKLDAGQVSETLLLYPNCFHHSDTFFLSYLLSPLYPLPLPFITLLTRFQSTFLS